MSSLPYINVKGCRVINKENSAITPYQSGKHTVTHSLSRESASLPIKRLIVAAQHKQVQTITHQPLSVPSLIMDFLHILLPFVLLSASGIIICSANASRGGHQVILFSHFLGITLICFAHECGC